MNDSLVKHILCAKVYDVAEKTPITEAKNLSKKLNNRVLFKREDLQPVFSFKIRGAYNKIAQLSEQEKQRGIIAASAGNHAQGVALSAQRLGVKAVIVMPQTTPDIKVRSVRAFGAEVVLHGDAYDQAYEKACELIAANDYTFIPPYDDELIIAGQGTVGLELIQQLNHIDAVFIPVGGGGLLAGIASYIKYLKPSIQIIAVESEESACFKAAFESGERVILDRVGIFADGVAVKQMGEVTWQYAQGVVDDAVAVSTDEICAAIQEVFEDTRSVMEPAGALSVAGMTNYIRENGWQDKTCVAILSGANLNFHRLRYISERAEIGEKREAIFAVTIAEQKGSFLDFCEALGKRNITEFNYRYDGRNDAQIYVGLTTEDALAREAIYEQLSADYQLKDLTDDDIAKLHIRYMVGGRPPEDAPEELVFSFVFPERPGALLSFLKQLGQLWNISLFHYRNHGAAYGRVLVGFHAQSSDREAIHQMLTHLGYEFDEQTDNPSYQQFLK